MTKARQQRRQQASPAPQARATGDSFQNFETALGYGAGNQLSSGSFGFDFISRQPQTLEAAYQSNWMAGAAVDIIAEDMTREGIDIHCDLDPDDVEQIQRTFADLGVWDSLCDVVKWSRLYGGAIGVIMIDGQRLDTPLRVDTIAQGQFKGVLDLDRWLVQPSTGDLVKEFGPRFGEPVWYDVIADSVTPLAGKRIHYSRVIRMLGGDIPRRRRYTELMWGTSVLEKIWDRILSFDSATMGAAQLVFKAHLRTYKIEGLREIIGTGGPLQKALLKQIEMIRRFQSNEGLTLMDAKDSFEAHAYTFTGLPDMILQFGQQLAGALQIPLVRLFGQSPAGLNSTGEADLRTYTDGIARQQNRRMRYGVSLLADIVSRSTLGRPLPDGASITFRPLFQLSAIEKAQLAQTVTAAVTSAVDSGMVSNATGLRELRQASHATGVWTNITDEMIDDAEAEAAPSPDEVLNEEDSGQGAQARAEEQDQDQAQDRAR